MDPSIPILCFNFVSPIGLDTDRVDAFCLLLDRDELFLNLGSVSGVIFDKPVRKLNCRLSLYGIHLRAQKGYEYFRYANRKEFSRCGPKKLWDSTEIDFSSLSSSILASGSPWNFEWFVKLRNFYFSECNLRAYHSFFGPQQCYPKLSVLESDRYLPSARS